MNVASSTMVRDEIRQAVKQTDESATVILFGSRARDSANEDSDWDILILVNKPSISIKDEQAFRHKLYNIELKFSVPISTFVYSSNAWKNELSNTPLYKNIEKEGVIL